MNYITNYYKNLCEKYEYQIHNLQKHLFEAYTPPPDVFDIEGLKGLETYPFLRDFFDNFRDTFGDFMEYPGLQVSNFPPPFNYDPKNGEPDPSRYFPPGYNETNGPKRSDFPPGPYGDQLYKEALKNWLGAKKRLNSDRGKYFSYQNAQKRKEREARNRWDDYYRRLKNWKDRGGQPGDTGEPKEPKVPKPPNYEIPDRYRVDDAGIAENWQI